MNLVKFSFVGVVLLAASLSQAESRGFLTFQPASICNSWSYMQGPNNTMGGYVCSGYPMSTQIVDPTSLHTTIQDLEMKIAILEERVKALEKKP